MRGMPTWELDGITFNDDQYYDGVMWTLEDEQGFWGSTGMDHQYTPKLGRHGSFMVPGYKAKDSITLTCSARAERDDYLSLRNAQMRAAALCSDADAPLSKLVCWSELGPIYASVALDGDILTKPIDIERPAFEFSVQLAAPDPRRYGLYPVTQETGLPQQSATGLDFNRPNLVVNGSFPTNTTGWSAQGSATLAQGTDIGPPARTYGQATSTQAATPSGLVSTAFITGLTAGTLFAGTCEVWSATVTAINMIVDWYTAANVLVSSSTFAATGIAASTWTTINGTATVPATATQAKIRVQSNAGVTIGQSLRTTSIVLYSGGLDFDTTGGLHFGAGPTASGFILLENVGTAPTQPVLTLYGPLTTPTITTGAGSIRYNATLAAGEWVVIDPGDPSVLFGGVTSRAWLVDPANWTAFTIPPHGSISIGLSHLGPSTDTGFLRAEFAPAYF